jgi:DNA processing protein
MAAPDERPRAPLSSAEAFARLRLLRSPRVGAVTYYHLLASHGSAAAALDALPGLAAQGGAGRGGAAYRPADPARIRAEMDALDAMGGRYLFHDDPDYPDLLAQVEGAPPILSLLGEGALLDRPGVAIVGARNASAAAMRLAAAAVRRAMASLAAASLACAASGQRVTSSTLSSMRTLTSITSPKAA